MQPTPPRFRGITTTGNASAPPVYRPAPGPAPNSRPAVQPKPQPFVPRGARITHAPVGPGRQQFQISVPGAGKPLGSLQLKEEPAGGIFISNLHVAEQHRNQGLATRLVNAAVDYARSRNVPVARLEARPSDATISLQNLTGMYSRMGFRQIGFSQRGNPLLEKRIQSGIAAPVVRQPVQRMVAPGRPGIAQPPIVQQKAAWPGLRGVIQRMEDYTESLLDTATDSGARLGRASAEWVDLDTVQRSKITWFGKSIQIEMGVDEKPASGAKCQKCGKTASTFHLDHMTPWRHYAAALVSEDYIWKNKGKTYIRKDALKVLYNDPQNLWWICDKCNLPKSDIIPETSAHASGDFSTGTYGRNAPKPSTFV